MLLGAPSTAADTISGDAVALAGDPAPFRWRVAECASVLESQWWAPSGEQLTSESVKFGPNGQATYAYERFNIHEQAEVEISGLRANIRLSQDGRIRSHEVSSELPILAGPMLITYARDRLSQLRAGAALLVAYVVPDHLTSVELRLRVVSASSDRISVQVAPLSALVRLVVSDATIDFDRNGRFIAFTGRVLPVRLTQRKREDVSARLVASGRSESCSLRRVATLEHQNERVDQARAC
jgi:hypothetical protein